MFSNTTPEIFITGGNRHFPKAQDCSNFPYKFHEIVQGSVASILAEFATLRFQTMVGANTLLNFEQCFHTNSCADRERRNPGGGSGMAALFLAQHFDQKVRYAVHDCGDLRKFRHRVHEPA